MGCYIVTDFSLRNLTNHESNLVFGRGVSHSYETFFIFFSYLSGCLWKINDHLFSYVNTYFNVYFIFFGVWWHNSYISEEPSLKSVDIIIYMLSYIIIQIMYSFKSSLTKHAWENAHNLKIERKRLMESATNPVHWGGGPHLAIVIQQRWPFILIV